MRPADDPLDDLTATYVSVEEGRVGSSIALNTTAEWLLSPIGVNRAAGVVTSVSVEPGTEVAAGAGLYSVDLRPVVIAQGQVPAFRVIEAGTAGEDVTQLQAFLAEAGFFSGDADGRARWDTVQAIRDWQESLGVEVTGSVAPGDVIFVPSLPTRVALDSDLLFRGASLEGGEEVLRGLPTAPSFRIPVTETQAGMITTGARVEVTSPDGDVWPAIAGDRTVDKDSGTVRITLTGPEGAPLCGTGCAQVPVSGQSSLASQIILVEDVEGLIVPSSALVTNADGTTAVIDQNGERHSVTVEASAKGMSVITGVDVGTRVRVPGQAQGEK
ncbi:peptidoglycan-binding protein [Microbacterium resistens]|nr:peptidoglycan-binding protein [Microbacterium resistens]